MLATCGRAAAQLADGTDETVLLHPKMAAYYPRDRPAAGHQTFFGLPLRRGRTLREPLVQTDLRCALCYPTRFTGCPPS
jgi:hypothetical protein